MWLIWYTINRLLFFGIGNFGYKKKIMRYARFIFGARMNNFHYKKELPKVPKFKAYTKLYYILFSKEWNFFAHFGSFSCFLFFFLHFFLFWEAMKYQWTRLSGTISILRFFKHYMCQTDKNSLAATISKLFDDVTDAVIQLKYFKYYLNWIGN